MTTTAVEDVPGFRAGLASYPMKFRFIFEVMVETGFRVSDVLNLKVRDVVRGKSITEKKTKKKRQLLIGEELKKNLLSYAKELRLRAEDFLFPSTRNNLCRPIGRSQVYRVFRAVSDALELDGVVRPHSCRKTYARAYMAKYDDLKALQKDLNHSSLKTTRGYLSDRRTPKNDNVSD